VVTPEPEAPITWMRRVFMMSLSRRQIPAQAASRAEFTK
jgi:hypothetical protein